MIIHFNALLLPQFNLEFIVNHIYGVAFVFPRREREREGGVFITSQCD